MFAYVGSIQNLKDLKDLSVPVDIPCNFHPSGWLRASALTRRLVSLVGVKWSCLRINKQAFAPFSAEQVPVSAYGGSLKNLKDKKGPRSLGYLKYHDSPLEDYSSVFPPFSHRLKSCSARGDYRR